MSRIRSIHPGIHTDERFAALSHAAWRLAMGILNECDDKGVFEWKPITLKMRIFPAHDDDIAALLSELEVGNIVRRYEIEGREYGAVRNFRKYQKPKKPNSLYPMPDELRTYVGLSDVGEENQNQMEEGGGKGRKTEPDGSEKKRGCRIPEDFEPDMSDALVTGLPLYEAQKEAAKFRDYWRSVAGAKGVKLDWPATWRNWCRKAADDRGLNPQQSTESEDQTWVPSDDPDWSAWADAEERDTGKRPKPHDSRRGKGKWFRTVLRRPGEAA